MKSHAPAASNALVLAPGLSSRQYWRDLWRYRELFTVLAWRDVAARYKQTAFGVSWALIRPLLTIFIFTTVFGVVANLPSGIAAPYALVVSAGMLPWALCSTAFSDAANSLVGNASLISKVYFPRMIVPASAVAVSLVDFLLGFLILLAVMFWYGFWPGWQVLCLPLFVVLALTVSIGPGLLVASLNVKYRDFRFVVPFVLQLGMYVSPVGFSTSVVPERWRLVFSLNPMVGVIDGFRWCLLGDERGLYLPGIGLSILMGLLMLFVGIRVFRGTEKQFADVI